MALYYKLNLKTKNVKDFLTDSAERMIKHNLESPDSNILTMVNNNTFPWYSFITTPIENINEVIQNMIDINTNEVMLNYIYKYLDKTLLEDVKDEIIDLLKNRNLLQQFILHLQKEFDRDTLSTVVLVQLNKKRKQASTEAISSPKKKKAKEESEKTEEMDEPEEESDEEYQQKKKHKHKKHKRSK